jgi:homocitrate synthase NifV
MAKSMFGSGRDFCLISANTASATASWPDFGAARRTRSSRRTARGSPLRYTAAYAFGQPLPPAWPGVGRNAFAHESGIHADGALKDRGNYELYDDDELGPFPADWFARDGRVVLTGEYGGKAGFRHVLGGLGIEVADGEEDLVFSLVQLCASATGKPLTDDELRLIAGYPRQLALLFPRLLTAG